MRSLRATLSRRLATTRIPHGSVDTDRQLQSRESTPLVSVVMTTYNHEKYVAEAIESVLNQTHAEIDFVIVNDGSTDRTDAIVRRYTDRRITYICQTHRGESAATNHGVAMAKGRYIAFMDGDDVCHPERLARQRDFLRTNDATVVTSWIDLIDDDSLPYGDRPDLLALCNCPPATSRAAILHRLWDGNYLWLASAMIDASLFHEMGGLFLSSLQLQDHMLWIEIVKHTHIATLSEPLLKYRLRAGAANSSQDPRNWPRTEYETKHVYRRFFERLPEPLFREAFADGLRNKEFTGPIEYAIERAFLYLTHPVLSVREIGVDNLFGLMGDPHVAEVLSEKYDFTLSDFFSLENDPAFLLSNLARTHNDDGLMAGRNFAAVSSTSALSNA